MTITNRPKVNEVCTLEGTIKLHSMHMLHACTYVTHTKLVSLLCTMLHVCYYTVHVYIIIYMEFCTN